MTPEEIDRQLRKTFPNRSALTPEEIDKQVKEAEERIKDLLGKVQLLTDPRETPYVKEILRFGAVRRLLNAEMAARHRQIDSVLCDFNVPRERRIAQASLLEGELWRTDLEQRALDAEQLVYENAQESAESAGGHVHQSENLGFWARMFN